jgi:membrane fusion protein, multidrug efflux system
MTDETRTTEIEEMEKPPKNRRALRLGGIALLVLAAAGGALYYVRSQAYESTDNAFTEANVIQVSPRAAGQVIRVYVQDNQHVDKGDLLVEIDPQDYQVRAEEAHGRLADVNARMGGAQSNLTLTTTVTGAQLAEANAAAKAAQEQIVILQARIKSDEASAQAAQAAVAQAQAHERAAKAETDRAAADSVRYRSLFAKDEVSRQQLDRMETAASAALAAHDAASQAVEAARAQQAQVRASQAATEAAIRQAESLLVQAQGRVTEAGAGPQQVKARQADLAALQAQIGQVGASVKGAELALSYTKIYAPESGYVTRKEVEPGNFVQISQPLMALVSDSVWVVANFKETQLANMRPGQQVSMKLDAFPQLRLRGHIDSIQTGTGARFSLLPAENATGNYVKVIQRVPVKIVLDEAPPAGYRIGPGMSVAPEVKVK